MLLQTSTWNHRVDSFRHMHTNLLQTHQPRFRGAGVLVGQRSVVPGGSRDESADPRGHRRADSGAAGGADPQAKADRRGDGPLAASEAVHRQLRLHQAGHRVSAQSVFRLSWVVLAVSDFPVVMEGGGGRKSERERYLVVLPRKSVGVEVVRLFLYEMQERYCSRVRAEECES